MHNTRRRSSTPDARLRQLLEKLDLSLSVSGKSGLGTNNTLFMACELILLAQESEASKLLLIEEPEAHLHPQKQLRVMKALQELATENSIQIIVTTHSPNLASVIELENLVLLWKSRAYSLGKESTKLSESDYSFLQRFLDVTKANLFFARGVLVVEGDARKATIFGARFYGTWRICRECWWSGAQSLRTDIYAKEFQAGSTEFARYTRCLCY